jgi:hypothetical protein
MLSISNSWAVVEWRLEGDAVNAWFRAPVDLDEREDTAVAELAHTVAKLDTVA